MMPGTEWYIAAMIPKPPAHTGGGSYAADSRSRIGAPPQAPGIQTLTLMVLSDGGFQTVISDGVVSQALIPRTSRPDTNLSSAPVRAIARYRYHMRMPAINRPDTTVVIR